MKVIMWILAIIFLIGLLVVFGVLGLVFNLPGNASCRLANRAHDIFFDGTIAHPALQSVRSFEPI